MRRLAVAIAALLASSAGLAAETRIPDAALATAAQLRQPGEYVQQLRATLPQTRQP
ncbi:hypothetical protein HH297_02495 [Xanthomonas sp. Kuri4-3]